MNAMVIGATGGIGAALVEALEARDEVETVFAASRSGGHLKAARKGTERLMLDVQNETSIVECAEAVRQRSGSLSLLIYAAGVLHTADARPERRLEQLEAPALDGVFAVNAFGPMLVAKHFWPLLKHDRRAVLANVSARVGSIGDNRLGGWYAYRCSKAALNMFTKTLSIELKRRAPNVICLAVHPGTVDTNLSKPFQASVPDGKLFTPAYAAARLLENIDRATAEASGSFLAWDGQDIEW